jgi:integration host factor subunit alpha
MVVFDAEGGRMTSIGEREMGKTGGESAGRTVTRADLAEAVYQRVGLSRTESAELVEMVLSEMAEALGKGDVVKLSSFGSFVVRSKGERIGRNPKTGIEVPITPRRVMVFKPSNILKSRVNGQALDEAGQG